MRRRVLNLATLLSLLLLAATAVLWVRSYRTLDQYCRLDDATGREDEVALLYGGVHLVRVENMATLARQANLVLEIGRTATPLPSSGRPPSFDWQVFYNRNVVVRLEFLGFQWLTGSLGTTNGMWGIRIPLWLPASLFALLPALWLYRRLRRQRPGRCPRCGYDLCARPDRCPECGALAGPA